MFLRKYRATSGDIFFKCGCPGWRKGASGIQWAETRMLLTCHSTRHSPHPAPGGRSAEVKKPGLNEALLLLLTYQQRPFFRQLASERDHENLAKVEAMWARPAAGSAPLPGRPLRAALARGCVVQQTQLDLAGTFTASSRLAGVSRCAWPGVG